jgi:hypothetical protein
MSSSMGSANLKQVRRNMRLDFFKKSDVFFVKEFLSINYLPSGIGLPFLLERRRQRVGRLRRV